MATRKELLDNESLKGLIALVIIAFGFGFRWAALLVFIDASLSYLLIAWYRERDRKE